MGNEDPEKNLSDLVDSDLEEEGGVETEDTGASDIIRDPFDPTLIRVDTKPATVDLIVSRIKNHEIDLAPGFQRKGGLWTPDAQSRLIESMLIRIPLPAFYMDATDENKWLVVDGLQRITTLKRFIIDKILRLSGLEFLTHLNGLKFDELPRKFQRRILETQITTYLIDEGTPAAVKFNIFKRINTGGLPLSAQEIRHALNQGSITRRLQDLAADHTFKEATCHSIRDDRMADREFVLRFLAFATTPYMKYKTQDFDGFLNSKMAEFNESSCEQMDSLANRFRRSMKLARQLFGDNAFRKQNSSAGRRMPINKALFEAWSVNLDRLDDDCAARLIQQKPAVLSGFSKLLQNWAFAAAISQGTGDIAKVRLRFSKIEELISEVLS